MESIIHRYRLDLEYDGSSYHGFQIQKNTNLKTIEKSIVDALFKLLNQQVIISVSGRTDTGVHALCQTIHFDLNQYFPEYKLKSGINYYLKKADDNISIKNCLIVDLNFHARLSAKMRHYQYRIVNRDHYLTIDRNRAWHIAKDINLDQMKIASDQLIGKHDFSSFRDADCQSKNPIKTIEKLEIIKNDQLILINISAKSFLHHMVRNITGTLVYFGLGKYKNISMQEIIEAKDRTKSGPNAPACGLYFLRTDY
jgi:tRNA pseudouridine38-40 synthase